MNELIIEGKVYVSSKQAALLSGYAKDYVGQMCREGRIEARLVGRNWYVSQDALKEHRFGSKESKELEDPRVPEPIQETPHAVDVSWKAPVYSPDQSSALPELSERPIRQASTTEGSNKDLVGEMQAAWQAWFSSKDVALEQDESDEVMMDEVESSVESEADTAPEDVGDFEENFGAAEEESVYEKSYPESVPLVRITETKVTRRERRDQLVTKRSKSITASQVVLIRAAFLLTATLSAVVGVIGTGLVDEFTGQDLAGIPVLNFIAGIEASKSSK